MYVNWRSRCDAMGGAQEIATTFPNAAEVLFKWAAKAFSEYEGYQVSWDPRSP